MRLNLLTLCLSIQLYVLIQLSFSNAQESLLTDGELSLEVLINEEDTDGQGPITNIECDRRMPVSDRPDLLQNGATVGEDSKLSTGDSLVSLNGEYKATVQKNGEIYVFDKDQQVISKAGMPGQDASSYTMRMQSDGNLVIYNDDTGSPTWATGTYIGTCEGNYYYLKLEDSGLLVMYADNMVMKWSSIYIQNNDDVDEGEGTVIMNEEDALPNQEYVTNNGCPRRMPLSDRPDLLQNGATAGEDSKLSTGDSLVSQNGEYKAVIQNNGEIYVLDKDEQIVSKAGNAGEQASSYTVSMQPDGNLVMYNDDTGSPTWASGTYTWGCAGNYYFLSLEDSGLLVLYANSMQKKWSSTYLADEVYEGKENVAAVVTAGEETLLEVQGTVAAVVPMEMEAVIVAEHAAIIAVPVEEETVFVLASQGDTLTDGQDLVG